MILRRRRFLKNSAACLTGLGVGVVASSVSRFSLATLPDIARQSDVNTSPSGDSESPFQSVVTLNGWSLPWRMNGPWKEFHLVAEPVLREFAPGMVAQLWGYNGQSPGPTIEVVEGDQLRIFVTNRLPEHTTIHWHGQRLPNGMDGVGGLTQPQIKPGKTFVYEWVAKRSGTFMYHPHADEMMQMAMGMMGFWVTHPKDPQFMKVDRDFCFLLNAFDIEPGSRVPRVNTMLDFNLWAFNSRVFPGIDPIVCRTGDRVRIRVGNLTMTNHPIHLHGHEFEVVGTDGGWVRKEARWPEVTTDIAVGQMRAIEFTASAPGDWAFHCHKSHHTMNAMSHDITNWVGVKTDDLTPKIQGFLPDYMPMGETGMAEMGDMSMAIPQNTLPMMMGKGQFGPLEMGGMFTVVKVRDNQPAQDYRDPGPYAFPQGTVAFEWTKEAPSVVSAKPAAQSNKHWPKARKHAHHD